MPSCLFTVVISLLFFGCLAALGGAAERAPERVRLTVSSKLDQQGKPDLPLDRIVDPTIVEEVLRERR